MTAIRRTAGSDTRESGKDYLEQSAATNVKANIPVVAAAAAVPDTLKSALTFRRHSDQRTNSSKFRGDNCIASLRAAAAALPVKPGKAFVPTATKGKQSLGGPALSLLEADFESTSSGQRRICNNSNITFINLDIMQRTNINREATSITTPSNMMDESFSENSTLEGSAYLSMNASDKTNTSSVVASEARQSRHSAMSSSNDGTYLSSVSELTPNSQPKERIVLPLQNSLRRANSGGGSGDAPPSRPRHRPPHSRSMPSAGFMGFPLEELKEDFDDSNSCFELGDSQSSNLFYKDESGEDHQPPLQDQSDDLGSSHSDNKSVVSLSGKKLLERKQRRETFTMLRRKSHRDLMDEKDNLSSLPPASPAPPTMPIRRPPSPTNHTRSDEQSMNNEGHSIINDGQSVISALTYDDESTTTSLFDLNQGTFKQFNHEEYTGLYNAFTK